MKYLVCFFVLISFLNAKIYRDDTQKVVVDDSAKLMWQDSIENVKVTKNHYDALEYCENLEYAGYSNWRLPNIQEYKKIVYKKNRASNINFAFKYNIPDGYWAKKAHWRTLWFYADYMFFISGTAYYDSRHKQKFVRCVRDIK